MLLKLLEEIEEIKQNAIKEAIPRVAEELRPAFFCRDAGDHTPLCLYWDYESEFIPPPINLEQIVRDEINDGSGPEEWRQIRAGLLKLAKLLESAIRKHE